MYQEIIDIQNAIIWSRTDFIIQAQRHDTIVNSGKREIKMERKNGNIYSEYHLTDGKESHYAYSFVCVCLFGLHFGSGDWWWRE